MKGSLCHVDHKEALWYSERIVATVAVVQTPQRQVALRQLPKHTRHACDALVLHRDLDINFPIYLADFYTIVSLPGSLLVISRPHLQQ